MSLPRSRFLMALLACTLLVAAPAVQAQVTTGALTGTVIAADGSALPGVTVEAIHTPTGTRYDTVTGLNGRWSIPNVRVGGPYRITAGLEGFRSVESSGVMVPLGGAADVPLTMQLAAVSEAITVTATTNDIINPNRAGSVSSVSEQEIESLPTVNRSLQDFARTNPYVAVDAGDESSTRMYVAGRNNRYNTIQIDGAVNNDLFGLADTGTPAGRTEAPPISLDAIEQIQVVISPYDVRQSGFTGGGINAVTRSGTNAIRGSAFYSKRDASFVGDGPSDRPITDFDSQQYGGRLGGPILRDRLFFFVNGEKNLREQPNGVAADGSAPIQYEGNTSAAAVRDFLMSRYNFDPGHLGDIPEERGSDNFFGRLDWNIGSANNLTLRHNYVDAEKDTVQNRGRFVFRFPNATYFETNETNSTVAQLNSAFSANAFNEARINYTTIRDQRATPIIFPSIEIGGTPRNGDVLAGVERFSGANALAQDVLALTNDFTLARGAHTLTIGTHNEFFEFENLFMSDAYGYYHFRNFDEFVAGRVNEYSITFASDPNNPRRPTAFEVAQYGLYASDRWSINPAVTLTFGLRADMPSYGDAPTFNQIVQDAIGVSTARTPSEDIVWSPRLGFNWQIGPAQQLRGGAGVFAGRTPYVWVSNAYGGTGVEQVSLSCRTSSSAATGCTPFVADPLNQPKNFPAGGGAFTVDLLDPDFEMPRVMRATLGYDTDLFFGIRGTAEVLYSQNLKDVYYQNLNKEEVGASELDGRPTYRSVSSSLRDAILLTNTGKGEQLMGSLQLNKNFGQFVTLAASYAYQDATSAFDGTSSRAISNWQFHHTKGDIFNPEVSRSPFETEHRLNIAASLNLNTGILGHSFGLYYNAQSGRPYSLMFGTDINRDGYSTNDLLYLAQNPIIQRHANSTWTGSAEEQWQNYLRAAGVNDPTAGRIMDRYELTEPWARQLDFRYELGLPMFRDFRSMITLDVLNVLNMIDSDYGVVEFVSNQNFSPVTYQGIDAATGRPIYRERFANSIREESQFSTADIRSRWQARLGVRVTF